jgi:hypothetical protein
MKSPRWTRRLTHNLGWKLACLGVSLLLWYWLVAADTLV